MRRIRDLTLLIKGDAMGDETINDTVTQHGTAQPVKPGGGTPEGDEGPPGFRALTPMGAASKPKPSPPPPPPPPKPDGDEGPPG